MTFGQRIAAARKQSNLSQKELASLIKKDDGQKISPQYLNDLEHDRRNPPSDMMIEQFAAVLHIPAEVLYYATGELPSGDRGIPADDTRVVRAYSAFRREIRGE